MTKIKTYRMSISRVFPATHPRAGEDTEFEVKIKNAIYVQETGNQPSYAYHEIKRHTIRANYPLWKKRIDEVNAGEAELVLYEWTGKPYKSGTRELFRFSKDDGIGVQELDLRLNVYNKTLAHNDGLSLQDFRYWFKDYDLSQPLAIIWFVNKRY